MSAAHSSESVGVARILSTISPCSATHASSSADGGDICVGELACASASPVSSPLVSSAAAAASFLNESIGVPRGLMSPVSMSPPPLPSSASSSSTSRGAASELGGGASVALRRDGRGGKGGRGKREAEGRLREWVVTRPVA